MSISRMRQSDQEPDFMPSIGVCTSIENAALVRDAGGDYLEEAVRRLLVPDQPESAFDAKLDAIGRCPLPIRSANSFLPGSLKCVGPDADHGAVLEYASTAFERGERVGIRTIVFGSSGSRSIPEGFDRRRAELQFVALLAKMGPLAAAHDLVVAVEPLNDGETNFINSLPEAVELVQPVDHPSIRLVADIYHMLRMDDPAASIRHADPFVHHVHIAERANRTAPGVDGDDFRPYIRALKAINWNGGISIECRWSSLTNQLAPAIRTLREQIADVN